MKTYIINLERSEKRREHIVGEAIRCGLDYELVKAVDGKTLTESDMARLCDMDAVTSHPEWLSPGMIGCSLSHYNVYRSIIENDIDIAFILEDDMVLPDDVSYLLEDIEHQIGENEVVTLYYMSFKPCKLSTQDVVELRNNYRIHFPMDVSQPITTGGYVITNAAARSLAAIVLPVRVGPDSWGFFYDHGGMESFRCVYPVPLRFNGAKSDIHSQTGRGTLTRFIDERKVPIAFQLLRAVRNWSVGTRSKIQFVGERSPVAQRKLS